MQGPRNSRGAGMKEAMESEETLGTVRQKIRRELDRLEERVAAYVRGNPTVSYKKIAERYGVSAGYVHKAAKKHGICRMVGRKKGAQRLSTDEVTCG
jgi:hypothetical protein